MSQQTPSSETLPTDSSDARIDAALRAFLCNDFPRNYSPEGAEHYRGLMAQAIAAYEAATP